MNSPLKRWFFLSSHSENENNVCVFNIKESVESVLISLENISHLVWLVNGRSVFPERSIEGLREFSKLSPKKELVFNEYGLAVTTKGKIRASDHHQIEVVTKGKGSIKLYCETT